MKYTIQNIMALRPCDEYSEERVTELWSGREALSLTEICDLDIPIPDRIWAATKLMPEREARHYAADCAQRVAHLNPDPRVQAAIDAARCFSDGKITAAAIAAARDAACDAAIAAAIAAAWGAACDAAIAAARAAARDAASAAARDAASAAARDAAMAAAMAAACDAACDAAAAWDAECEWQITRLREICDGIEAIG